MENEQEFARPIAWCVTGTRRLYNQYEAEQEAQHCGGSTRAYPVYAEPFIAQPVLTAPARELSNEEMRNICREYKGNTARRLSENWDVVTTFARDCIAAIAQPKQPDTLTMRPMESEDGTKGWYIDGPDFYCDIERAPGKQYSIFIRHKDGTEGFAEMSQPVAPAEVEKSEQCRHRYVSRGIGPGQCLHCGIFASPPAVTAADVPAIQVQEPVAYVTGYYAGRCVIEPINRAMVMPHNMSLYAGPQPEQIEPITDEQLVEFAGKYRRTHPGMLDSLEEWTDFIEFARAVLAKGGAK